MNYVALDVGNLALAAVLILLNAAISWGFQLGSSGTFLAGSSRSPHPCGRCWLHS
jgi:hypothetical protein